MTLTKNRVDDLWRTLHGSFALIYRFIVRIRLHFAYKTIWKYIIFLYLKLLLKVRILLFKFLNNICIDDLLKFTVLYLQMFVSLSDFHVWRYIASSHFQHVS